MRRLNNPTEGTLEYLLALTKLSKDRKEAAERLRNNLSSNTAKRWRITLGSPLPPVNTGGGGLGLNYEKLLNDTRSELGIHVYRTIRSVTARLNRHLPRYYHRDWTTFIPKELSLPISELVWPTDLATPWRKPFAPEGRVEACLMHLYTWAGATLLARSARSLQWSFTILGSFLSLWQSNGLKTAGAAFKEASRVLMKYISGTPVKAADQSGVPIGIEKGLPTILPRGLRRYIADGHVVAIRLAFFMLNAADLLKYEAPPKLTTITEPYNGVLYLDKVLETEIRQAVEELCAEASVNPTIPQWKKFHVSIKAGPNGRAMLSAPLDAVALQASGAWDPFLRLASLMRGGSKLVRATERLAWLTRTFMRPFWSNFLGSVPIGKLSNVTEPRGKVRVVAIPGYQIQSLLKPLHDTLYDFLRNLQADHTFDQDRGVRRCIASGQKTMNSYDLSAATDRFPIWFEETVLRHLFSKSGQARDFSTAWRTLLESLEFVYRLTPRGRLHTLKYGSGQPMGTYSSWASFAVSHHVVVRVAARRAGFPNFNDYDLLGDDIVLRGDTIQHELVFAEYRNLMRDLGVGINPSKGVHSTNGSFEFAKRFVRGKDVLSSLRWKELCSVTSWKRLVALPQGMARRGLPLPHLRVLLEVGYQLIFKLPFRYDLTDPRRVSLTRQRTLREALVMLTSPVGPYKVTYTGWLSLRGISHVDFHPNMGHFVNNITRVVMGHEMGVPAGIGLDQVRKDLLKRILEAQGTALGTIKTFLRTVVGRSWEGGEALACAKSLWHLPSVQHVTDALRGINLHSYQTLNEILVAIGAHTTLKKEGAGKVVPNFQLREIMVPYRERDTQSHDLRLGLLRTIISIAPARAANLRVLLELLGPHHIKDNPMVDPDAPWSLGSGGDGGHLPAATPLREWAERVTASIIPKKFSSVMDVLQKSRECITDYMKFSVADILPQTLPSHLDMKEITEEVMSSFTLKAWRALRDDTAYETGLVFTLPEGTDQSLAPAYILDYTNGVRLCSRDPGYVPPNKNTVDLHRLRLAEPNGSPLVFVPVEGYRKHFLVPSNVKGFTGHMLMHMHPEQFRAMLCEGFLPPQVSRGFAEMTPEDFRSTLTESGI